MNNTKSTSHKNRNNNKSKPNQRDRRNNKTNMSNHPFAITSRGYGVELSPRGFGGINFDLLSTTATQHKLANVPTRLQFEVDTDLLETFIDDAITKIAAKYNVTVSATSANVLAYMDYAINTLIAFAELYRAQSTVESTDKQGRNLVNLLLNIPTAGYQTSTAYGGLTATSTPVGNDSISNALMDRDWETD